MTAGPAPDAPEVWYHALGARVGGGLTYLHAVAPRMAAALRERGARLVLLLPGDDVLPELVADEWVERRPFPDVAGRPARRLLFDRVGLPRMLAARRNAALFCSGSMGPARPGVRSVVLVRNALWFDREFLAGEAPRQRMRRTLERRIVRDTVARAAAVHYPSSSMRAAAEEEFPEVADRGRVNPYGLPPWPAGTGAPLPRPSAGRPPTFLYVLTYTAHKNLTYLLRALALARAEGLPVRVIVTTDLSDPPPRSAGNDSRILRAHRLVEEGYLVPCGTVRGEALRELYLESDGCVFPSLCESFGHPLVEALHVRRPLLCSDLPWAREIAGENARYFDPHRPETLVELWRNWPAAVEGIPFPPPGELESRFSWDRHVEALLADLLPAGGGG